ncbi:MAG: metallopeptidase family protein [Bacteroidetes bacterium]|nr:metallopeptidase family protein [Bacteroidota bacterium]
MSRELFEQMVQEAFNSLPERFQSSVENVRVIVEERDSPRTREKIGVRSGSMLLGLYEGIPLTKRGSHYGMSPAVPDTITLYQRNIEAVARTQQEVYKLVREVLIHELGHYFGMTEDDIRRAGY